MAYAQTRVSGYIGGHCLTAARKNAARRASSGPKSTANLRFIYFWCFSPKGGTMVMLKISAFLVAYALVICQMYCSQAAPARPALESMSERVTLTDYEARRLLNAIVKEFVQMTAEELEQQQQAAEGNSVTAQKRACNTATCVTHRLADFLSRSGGMGNSNFVPTNVGAKAFGRRRRSIAM
ncbi:calcitonin gene-related peptide-like isoform X3 [Phyllopteryx taeniolatus]|uniref:calcitonin gene-related peptide-like isoform X3 n=1 Tax=Phyllopteryx taeniolatus TaxID=161469 RepID=UPI002AD2AFC5|nr:calcitonin gene-related peptide-like isoform X3 [Phyllopteryx taeniolatus]